MSSTQYNHLVILSLDEKLERQSDNCGSLYRQNPRSVILGIYDAEKPVLVQIMEQVSNQKIIAWKLWEDSREARQLATHFVNTYGGKYSESQVASRGDYSRLAFSKEVLEKILADVLFSIPETE